MDKNIVVIMAAGEGTRMKSDIPKVMHKVGNRPMIDCVIDAAAGASPDLPVVVVGNGREIVTKYLGKRAQIAVQEEQKGTGHAVMMARDFLEKKRSGYTVVLAGDMPLLRAETIENLCREAKEQKYACTVLTSVMKNPTGYGRIVRLSDYTVESIVEEADADDNIRGIKEVNTSVYCFETKELLDCLEKLTNDNKQGEYYLTDCISMMVAKGARVGALSGPETECMGVNNRLQLAQAEKELRKRTLQKLMINGVTMIDPSRTYVDARAKIGYDTVIEPGVVINGECTIGKGCYLYSGTRIEDSSIGDNVSVDHSVIVQSTVGDDCTVGPFAYMRPNSTVGNGCKVGDFVEIKNASVGDGTKVPHLTYVGDGEVGENCNISCGTIFANYDGKNKYRTTVGDNVFIGSNATLIAPVTVHDGAFVAAGSTIHEDVPGGSMAIARERQSIKDGWADKRREEGKLK